MKEQNLKNELNRQQEMTPWKPTYKWFAKVMGGILAFLIIVFIVGNIILKPYMKESPIEITPWLDKSKPKTSILGI